VPQVLVASSAQHACARLSRDDPHMLLPHLIAVDTRSPAPAAPPLVPASCVGSPEPLTPAAPPALARPPLPPIAAPGIGSPEPLLPELPPEPALLAPALPAPPLPAPASVDRLSSSDASCELQPAKAAVLNSPAIRTDPTERPAPAHLLTRVPRGDLGIVETKPRCFRFIAILRTHHVCMLGSGRVLLENSHVEQTDGARAQVPTPAMSGVSRVYYGDCEIPARCVLSAAPSQPRSRQRQAKQRAAARLAKHTERALHDGASYAVQAYAARCAVSVAVELRARAAR
jgi:hypothetical protein